MWSQQDPGEPVRQIFLERTLPNTEVFALSARVRAPHSLCQRCRSPVLSEWMCTQKLKAAIKHLSESQMWNSWSDIRVEAIIHTLNSVCSVSGVKLVLFIAIVVVFFCLFFLMIWSHSGTFMLRWCYLSHPVKCCLFHQQMRALWVCTCTPQVSVDSLHNCFYFYLNTI